MKDTFPLNYINVLIIVFKTTLFFPTDRPSSKAPSNQTTMSQRLNSVLKTCQRAVGSPRKKSKNIKFNIVYTTSSQASYRVHTTFPQRKELLQRVHAALTARKQRA